MVEGDAWQLNRCFVEVGPNLPSSLLEEDRVLPVDLMGEAAWAFHLGRHHVLDLLVPLELVPSVLLA